ncbi:purine-nucleoside phosphorylase [Brevibacillus sp. 7WMA2]|uniref:Purine nucleoside phosphorylase n=1 Tax=Brevibacillus laterosporus LMG 15441 TaxID=1042163 RepID=A0A075R2H3_BRELA|nr:MULTISPECIES: purine-nucleoside phosphorylase [Brevibacillus]AIG26064.1 purine nucleoside phosphorylase 1 [Brevibacillus laterosporus LMG 15441]AYK07612.1 purine-nucleoside phosphorylase [Brevibacillus laterosporus]ERM20290.1 purine nucleoside phosphorylase [Brevibacillus laterosporus PE36]MCR8966062.1 purine-nucleoside phosphorylase [Brevibacillus laterosporus]MCR8995185.1 purine-nucleoside phosphorylase [Brevibacillus laterosporus]
MSKILEAKAFIEEKLTEKPTIGLVLGSGLGVLADEIEETTVIPYNEIPHFTKSTVVGHKGQLVIGKLKGKQVVAMQGRFHYYEGHELEAVVFPIRVMKAIGVETIIVTNAAGGINESYKPGDLMLISDHLNLTYRNPLIGGNDESLGARFPDMSEAYSKRLRKLSKEIAATLGIQLQEGVYAGLLGPSYETPAEIRMLRILGGDAVGMSTVPEVIVARHMNIEVLGISCISNMAAGILDQPLSHDEVMETTEKVKAEFLSLVKSVIEKM